MSRPSHPADGSPSSPQPHLRGRLVALQQFGIDCGILIGYLIQYGCSFIEDGRSELNFRLSWCVFTGRFRRRHDDLR